MRSLCLPLAASLAAAFPSLGSSQTPPAAAQPAASQPSPGQQPARRYVDLHNLSCEQYMALDDTLRPPVVWYIAGDYKAAGPLGRSFDPELVGNTGAHVWTECKNHPQANLRYVVMGYFKSSKARAEERAARLGAAAKGKPRGPGHLP
ncbi:MAG: hypothetical protein HZB56_11975 [Deltaproteobacteria bacterium]|nr:hypothetical protein [Deltaproteobacteria bacterium]